MELHRLILKLRAERSKLDEIIASLEHLEKTSKTDEAKKAVRKRRGRKSMDAAARQEVSERMKKYWRNRRLAKGALAEASERTAPVLAGGATEPLP
jgi:hypothetical protein